VASKGQESPSYHVFITARGADISRFFDDLNRARAYLYGVFSSAFREISSDTIDESWDCLGRLTVIEPSGAERTIEQIIVDIARKLGA
jgi:hypothetical protein